MAFEKENINHIPSMMEISEYIQNPVYDSFCNDIIENYEVKPIFEFSKCSMEYGWNVKFKKFGKSICTIYPKEGFFTVLVVIGNKEKKEVEESLNSFSGGIRKIYNETQEGMGQKWLMINIEDKDQRYKDTLNLIEIRKKNK